MNRYAPPSRESLLDVLMLLEMGMDECNAPHIEHAHSILQSLTNGEALLDADTQHLAKIRADAVIENAEWTSRYGKD